MNAILDSDTDSCGESRTSQVHGERYGSLSFTNCLECDFQSDDMQDYHLEAYEGAMQYLHWNEEFLHSESNRDFKNISANQLHNNNELVTQTVRRCSLVRATYQIIGEGESYQEVARSALEQGLLNDMFQGGVNEEDTWKVRLRQYGSTSKEGKEKQYGKKMRSPMAAEKKAIIGLKDILIKLGGNVDLKDAHCSLYIFDEKKFLQGNLQGVQRLLRLLLELEYA